MTLILELFLILSVIVVGFRCDGAIIDCPLLLLLLIKLTLDDLSKVGSSSQLDCQAHLLHELEVLTGR